MDKFLADLKTLCFQLPHWQQLVLQAFFYGLLTWLQPLAQIQHDPDPSDITTEDLVAHAHPIFREWPSQWLEPYMLRLVALKLDLDQLYDLTEALEDLFRDCIPVDLNIFSELSNGSEISEEQLDRLYDTVAFQPPAAPQISQRNKQKTRRTHGKRGLTPIKRRRAYTHHRSNHTHVSVVKLSS